MELVDIIYDYYSKNLSIHMEPNEVLWYNLPEEYKLRVRCYAWRVRNYSIWYRGECDCHSNTIEWLLVQIAPRLF